LSKISHNIHEGLKLFMAKKVREQIRNPKTTAEHPIIPPKYQHAAAVAVLFLSIIIFFAPIVFNGKIFVSVDSIGSHSWETLQLDAKEQGIFPLWNPYIFCGMPGYASLSFTGERLFDLSAMVLGYAHTIFQYIVLNASQGWVLFYYFVFAVGIYTLTFNKLNNKIAALIAALGATFSTRIIVWVMISHLTKMPVMCWFPWIILCLDKLRMRFDWKSFLALVLLIHFSFLPSHMQMIFYLFLALGLYLLYELLATIIKKTDWKPVLRLIGSLVVAIGIAFAMNADKYLSVLEYGSYSIRGSAPIVKTPGEDAKTQAGGLGYEYATEWSFAPGEMMTFVVPSWYGFGSHEYSGRLVDRPVHVNTYWGPQSFVDCPNYMGIVILAFALVGIVRYRKDSFVQYMVITIIIATLISFGREFSLVYDLMFKYFPGFNKFRVPITILVLVQIFLPILAAYGITSLMAQRGEQGNTAGVKKIKYAVYGLGIFLVLTVIGRSAFESLYTGFFPFNEAGPHLARAIGTENPGVISEFYNFVVNSVMSDLYFGLVLLLASFGSIWLFLKGSLKVTMLTVILILAVIVDLWRVDKKPMEPREKQVQTNLFDTPDYASYLLKDKTLYRTLEFENGQPPYSNMLAYWRIQSAYGYQGVKMRQIQDVFDVVGLGNPLLWGLMNVKYIISDRSDSNQILQPVFKGKDKFILYNRAELPRAFFVDRYETAKGLDILNRMKSMDFNPRDVAFFLEDPKLKVDVPQIGAEAHITRYELHNVELKVKATGNNLLFLSESWYPNGWKAYIDGAETTIYRINYMFRGIVVPTGEHVLTMKFEPASFSIGKSISLGTNLLVLSGFLVFAIQFFVRKKKES
jgi:hypothetical protein